MKVSYSKYDLIAGENLGARKVIYIDANGKVKLAKANSFITSDTVVGITSHSALLDEKVLIYTNDSLNGFTDLSIGTVYYLSQTTFGELTNTKPSNGIIIKIGVAVSATELDIHIDNISLILKSPDGTNWMLTVDNDGVLTTEEIT